MTLTLYFCDFCEHYLEYELERVEVWYSEYQEDKRMCRNCRDRYDPEPISSPPPPPPLIVGLDRSSGAAGWKLDSFAIYSNPNG